VETLRLKYREEAQELIAEIEKSLLGGEAHGDQSAIVEHIFRAMHTLKGNSAMFGFKRIEELTHQLESIYELVRTRKLAISDNISNLTLASLDHLSALLHDEEMAGPQTRKVHDQLMARIAGCTAALTGTPLPAAMPEEATHTFDILFSPDHDLFAKGFNPVFLFDELHTLGRCRVTAQAEKIPVLDHYNADTCYTSWHIALTTAATLESISEIFSFLDGRCVLEITPAADTLPASAGHDAAGAPLPGAGEAVVKTEVSTGRSIISGIRVPSERLDKLMNLVSELMTLQAKLGVLTDQSPNPELLAVTESLEKISSRLRDNAFNMCLVPVEHMMTPFQRLVRDLSRELKKDIAFITEGTETELDKNIMESLSDPIMHILRNSIDHGIEMPDARVAAGKPRRGNIIFKAFCTSANVHIEIRDDGKGMDVERIKAKAIQKGFITPTEVLTDQEILNLIFLPGFSTAEQVSEVSGRGVGMDVVKKKIAGIRGQIKLNSTLGAGTSIIIKLPITVSIIDGLQVKIGGTDFVIPMAVIDKCYEVTPADLAGRFNNLVVLEGEPVPFIRMADVLTLKSEGGAQEIVTVMWEDKRVALVIDRVVGKLQAVLKPLGKYYQHIENISGATILGDGNIALVLDTNKLIEEHADNKVKNNIYQ
jgi:two-component system, chemotaxis family, sensor kinase CheA